MSNPKNTILNASKQIPTSTVISKIGLMKKAPHGCSNLQKSLIYPKNTNHFPKVRKVYKFMSLKTIL